MPAVLKPIEVYSWGDPLPNPVQVIEALTPTAARIVVSVGLSPKGLMPLPLILPRHESPD